MDQTMFNRVTIVTDSLSVRAEIETVLRQLKQHMTEFNISYRFSDKYFPDWSRWA